MPYVQDPNHPNNPNKKRWEPDDFEKVEEDLKKKGKDPFDYSKKAMATGSSLSETNDPTKHGYRISADLPNAEKTSIVICTDVTGSGNRVPRIIRENTPKLMGLLSVQGYVDFPDIQMMAVGDARTDNYPLQVPEFESSAEKIDEALTATVLEGNGGGQGSESYELAMWYACNMNKLASWKRKQKGFFFIIGDELPCEYVDPRHVAKYILGSGSGEAKAFLQGQTQRIPLSEVIEDQLDKYHTYYIICEGSNYYDDATVTDTWKELLGSENVIKLPHPENISETIASIVGYKSGVHLDKIQDDLKSLGNSKGFIDQITKTLTLTGAGNAAMSSMNIVPSKSDKPTKAKRF